MGNMTQPRTNQLLTEGDLAAVLRVPASTLRFWRWAKRGPRYLKLGYSVRYSLTDLEAWLASRPSGGGERGTADL